MPTPSRDKTAHDLDWAAFTEHLASLCLGATAAERLRELEPEATRERAVDRMQLTAEALAAEADDAPIPVRALPELEDLLPRIERGAVASGPELRDLSLGLVLARELRTYAHAQRERRPLLADALGSDPALERLSGELERCIEPSGEVADGASPELGDARRRVAEVRRELAARLGQLVRRYAEVLRDTNWTERDGRFVLPVRSDAHLRVPGIVLGSSASGGTLYVEPAEVTAIGNRLKVAEADVEREVARILAALCAQVGEQVESVRQAVEACVTADLLAALTRWALETRSLALVPTAVARAELRGVRHPLLLLQGAPVVPNDVQVAAGSALVISGPNAGGKTVALKCLGLAAWMARAGVPLPVDPGSVIGWFEPVLSDIGDDQSLARSLSTFSAHIVRLASILELADAHTLVLLDEVAAGTDPEEGSALAAALLEALVARGAAVAVTTHYERLKELGASHGAFHNASVGFDLGSMSPTFRLTLGIPGASSALAVAARFGIPSSVIDRAETLLPERAIEREELVQRLERERQSLERARATVEEEARRQRQLTAEIESERARAREQERARLAEQARELTQEVRQARARLRELGKRLGQGELGRDALRLAEREIDGAARHIAIGSALSQASRGTSAEPGTRRGVTEAELTPGTRVFLPKLGTQAEVVEPPHKGSVRVMAGVLKLSVPLADLELASAPAGPPRAAPKKPARKSPSRVEMVDGFVPVRVASNTLDLRGVRVEEALDRVDAFVDQMLRHDERVGFVLHGHGTGALKLAVRAHLSAAAPVRRAHPAEPEDGGDAFTVFWLDG